MASPKKKKGGGREKSKERRKSKRKGGKRQECIQEMLANKNTLLRKNRQMHKKCINFVQVNAIVNSRIHRPHNTFVMAYLKCL